MSTPEKPGPPRPSDADDPRLEELYREALDGDDDASHGVLRALQARVDSDRPYGRLGRPFARRSAFAVGFVGAFGAMLAITLWEAAGTIISTLLLIVMALFLAVGLNTFVVRLEQRGMRRGLAITSVLLGVLAFFVFAAATVVPMVFQQITDLIDAAPSMLDSLQSNRSIAHLDSQFGLIERAQDALASSSLTSAMVGGIVGAGRTLLGVIFKLLTLLVLTIYFLVSLDGIKKLAYHLVPTSRRARVSFLGDGILERIGGYIGGALTIASFAGVSAFVFFEIAGVDYAVSLALMVAVTDVIPMIGATLGAAIAVGFAATQSITLAIASAIFFTLYQQLENYLIYPRVMKRAVDVHPAAAIVAALIGGTLLGLPGALLAIPMAAAIQLILAEVVFPRQDQPSEAEASPAAET